MKNVFFIQRAAIDVLLLNNATAMDICTYLVILKHTNRHGYYSGVGFKSIKERLGVGQKKVDEAIDRLRKMEYAGQRLLFTLDEWLFKQTGSLPESKKKVGWVRGWFASEYKHHVWLSNNLVGRYEDQSRPLNYFVKNSGKDNHAQLLMLLYKYSNRQYSGVNYKFASVTSKIASRQTHEDVEFKRSELGGYHISQNILAKFGIFLSHDDVSDILSDLLRNSFMNISVSVIGNRQGFYIPARNNGPKPIRRKRRISSHEQYLSYKAMTDNCGYHSFKLALKLKGASDRAKLIIKLVRCLKYKPMVKFSPKAYEPLLNSYEYTILPNPKFLYRLDYKSNKKIKLCMNDCLASKIETITSRGGLVPASRKGKFYNTYWWFTHGESNSELLGLLMPSYMPYSDIPVCPEATSLIDRLNTADNIHFSDVSDNYI